MPDCWIEIHAAQPSTPCFAHERRSSLPKIKV
jgi:hypothetical protein